MRILNKKVGDVYLNPFMNDLWILGKIWDDEQQKEIWVFSLVGDDYYDEVRFVKGFIKLGNIYDIDWKNKSSEKDEEKEEMTYYENNSEKNRKLLCWSFLLLDIAVCLICLSNIFYVIRLNKVEDSINTLESKESALEKKLGALESELGDTNDE